MEHMSEVSTCGVDSCSYNINSSCNALAITIKLMEAAAEAPSCGTYADITHKATYRDTKAGVGACQVADCAHNKDLECTRDAISIDEKNGKILCLSFEAK